MEMVALENRVVIEIPVMVKAGRWDTLKMVYKFLHNYFFQKLKFIMMHYIVAKHVGHYHKYILFQSFTWILFQ